jgi:hypothetical protein
LPGPPADVAGSNSVCNVQALCVHLLAHQSVKLLRVVWYARRISASSGGADDVRRKRAQLIIEKYDNLLDIGVDEKDALCILGIIEKFDKIKSYLA